MSQENVEVVRGTIEAWNAGDMERLREMYSPEAISRPISDWPEAELQVGRNAIMKGFAQMRETYEGDDVVEIDSDPVTVGDRVLVQLSWKGVGRGPDMNLGMTAVYTVRQGRVFEIEYFRDHAQALEAVGLRE